MDEAYSDQASIWKIGIRVHIMEGHFYCDANRVIYPIRGLDNKNWVYVKRMKGRKTTAINHPRLSGRFYGFRVSSRRFGIL